MTPHYSPLKEALIRLKDYKLPEQREKEKRKCVVCFNSECKCKADVKK